MADSDTEKAEKAPKGARHLKEDRIRICGKWQKKGYEPGEAELAKWARRCKDRNLDPKTGKPKVDKTAPTQK